MLWRLPFLCLLALLAVSLPMSATTLTFDIFNPTDFPVSEGFPEFELVNQVYGDRVSTTQTTDGNFTYNYLIGAEGATPNVTVDYGPFSIFTGGPTLWRYDYGDLDRVLFQGSVEVLDAQGQPIGFNYDWMFVTLRADPGYEVLLYGFDMATWTPVSSSLTIGRLAVFGEDVSGPDLPVPAAFEELNATIPGLDSSSQPTRAQYAFSSPIRGNTVTILIDARNLGAISDAIGIDNIRFGQEAVTPVPEPATYATMLLGLGLVIWRRRTSRAS